jgi:hypothetical protein
VVTKERGGTTILGDEITRDKVEIFGHESRSNDFA